MIKTRNNYEQRTILTSN